MNSYMEMNDAARRQELESLRRSYEALCGQKLKLNMARGKPGKAQLDLVSDILTVLTKPEDCVTGGVDARNYGELTGLACAKELWADLLGCKPAEIIVGGNASLNLMYDVIARGYIYGLLHSPRPWCREERLKFLCPAPGYDRHFRITESFGMELITVPMLPTGPDMDVVEKLVQDPALKGIWCVPKYSNPQGYIYSDETVRRLAGLCPAAPDFALMWDNAYCLHEFDSPFIPFADILTLCREAGNGDMVYEFASTSKITMPGAGISCLAASEANIAYMTKLLSVQTISYDKMNQLRHVLYLKDRVHTLELMARHGQLVRPKFRVVIETLRREVGSLGIATWTEPTGGYFVSLDAMPGTAKRTLELCKAAGVTMTPAGAAYPYGIDPADSNIRISPTVPSVEELRTAMEILCVCLRIAALEKLLQE